MKKKTNLFLLIFVLGLWGTVLYRYVNQYVFKQEIQLDNNNSYSHVDAKIRDKEVFDLQPVKRDPFLNNNYVGSQKTNSHHQIKNTGPSKKIKPAKVFAFPDVEYYGYIKNKETQKELVLIKRDGILLKLKLNEEKDGLKITKIYHDSIQISYNKKLKYIRRNNI